MKYFLIIILSTLLTISCNEQSKNDKSSGNFVELIDSNNIEINEDLIVEDTYNGLQNGIFLKAQEIKKQLNTFCNYNSKTKTGDFVFKSISADINYGTYTKACEYDLCGVYQIHTNDNSFESEFNYPVLEHNYDDSNYFAILESIISQNGRNILLKVKHLSYNSEKEGYQLDNIEADKSVELSINNSFQMVLADRIDSKHPRYFINENQLESLPEPECDEDYH